MATGTGTRKRATAADIAAAVAIGAMDGSAIVSTDSDDDDDDSAQEAQDLQRRDIAATSHVCAIPGCRHGDAHTGVTQPDRQVKLECPNCGAVARMTNRALARAGSINCNGDGGTFAVAARRTYNRKGN